MRMAFTLAWRYLSGRKLRSFLTTLAVVFGVMILFGLNAFIPTFIESFRANLLAAAGKVDLAVTSETDASFPFDVLQTVRHVDGVSAATPLLRRQVSLPPGAAVSGVTVTGVDPATVQGIRGFNVQSGRFLTQGDSNAMVISQSLAQTANLHVGDSFQLPSAAGSTSFRVAGIMSARAVGVEEVFVPLGAAQALLSQQGRIDEVDASFSAGANPAEVKRVVAARLGPRYKLEGLDTGSQLFASIQLGEFIFNMFGVLALAMGGFIIFNTFRTIVTERRRDIGMLRAVGASRGMIVGIVGAESLLQGIIGTGIGLVMGYLIAVTLISGLNPIYEQYLHFRLGAPVFTLGNLLTAVSLGIGVTLVGGLWPAIAASRIMPLDALRPQAAEVERSPYLTRGLTGAGIIALAVLALFAGNAQLGAWAAVLFIVGLIVAAPAIVRPIANVFGRALTYVFATEGELASANLARQPGRAAVTASAMMISLAIVVALAGMTSSIFDGFLGYLDKSLGADFLLLPRSLVLSAGNVGAGPQLANQVRSTPGVETVTTLRLATTTISGTGVQAIGIDPVTYPKVSGLQFSSGDANAAYADLGAGRSLIANGIYASAAGVQAGQRLTLKTPQGDKVYTVAGIASDYLNAKLNTIYISQADMRQDFNVTADVLVMANAVPGADQAATRAAIDKTLKRYPTFQLFSAGQWRAMQEQTFTASISSMYFLIVLLAAPSLLALLNTLAINVLERTREIGMLRAVGSTRRQVRRMILAESLLLSATGTGFGLLGGVWLGYALITGLTVSGFAIPYYFPWAGVITAVGAGLLVGVTASLVPARQAARLDIVEALHFE